MIWALLVALGVPLWLVAGGLCAALISRRRVMRLPGTFTCKARCEPGGLMAENSSAARWFTTSRDW